MKKKRNYFFSKREMKKKRWIMRLMTLFLFVCIIQLSANAEKQHFTLSMKNVNLETVMEHIKTHSEYYFLYKNSDIASVQNLTIKVSNVSVEEVLKICLQGTDLTFSVDENIILIKKSGATDKLAMIEKIEVKGKVTDKDGNPLPGATVLIKGTTKGTTTNVDGNYTLKVPKGTILVFSFVGFEKQEVVASPENTKINVVMQEAATELEEVTINAGYYTVTEKTKTGNIAKVTAKEMANQPVANPIMALQGRVAGLEIAPASGAGVAPTIRIRGHNSLRALDLGKSVGSSIDGNLPLYIIDGIPVSSESLSLSVYGQQRFGGKLDPLSTINTENIQSIEVLKDADATAIYGSRGANGVILITTKKGRTGKTDLDINFYQGAGSIPRKLDLLKTQQYLAMRHEAFNNDGVTPSPTSTSNADINGVWDTTRYTDWQDELLGGVADITDLQMNVSGGNAQTTFRLGASYHQENMIYGSEGYHRLGGNLSLNHTSSNGKFTAGVAINYGVDKNKSSRLLVSSALSLPPNAPSLFLENGEINWGLTSTGLTTWTNPMASRANPATSENRNLAVSVNLSYTLLTGLRVKTNLGYTDLNGNTTYKNPSTVYAPIVRQYITPSADFGTNHRQSLLIEPQLNYVKKFGKHKLDMVVGFSCQENLSEYQLLQGSKYTSDALLNSIDAAGAVAISSSYSNYKYNSGFARIGYNYKERYLLNLTGRREGSSRFGPENRFGNFGAIGAAWIFSDEPWIKQVLPSLSFGKLRASYGVTGNDMIGDYNYYDLYKMATSTVAYEGELSLYANSIFNPNFQWEQTRKLEIALELNFLHDKLGLEVSWYRNRSSNQLVNYTLPATTGFSSVLKNFEATVQNTGWEILLRADLVRSENLQWSVSANLSIPRNKLVAFPGIEDSPYATYYKVGEPLSIQRTYIWTGVDPETGLHTFLDVDENGAINSNDKQFSYSKDSKFYGGLSSILRYKGFELSFLLRFKEQKARLNPIYIAGSQRNIPVWVWNERWQQPGDITNVQRFTQTSPGSTMSSYYTDSDAMTDASFVRLQSLSLSYTLPQALAKKAGAKMAKIFLQGQNLFTISGYNRYVLDVENESYPQLRIITAGLQLKF